MKFRRKPVEIDAMQFTYPPSRALLEFCGDALRNVRKARHPEAVGMANLYLDTLGLKSGVNVCVIEGDWIVKTLIGGFSVYPPDAFGRVYEPA